MKPQVALRTQKKVAILGVDTDVAVEDVITVLNKLSIYAYQVQFIPNGREILCVFDYEPDYELFIRLFHVLSDEGFLKMVGIE